MVNDRRKRVEDPRKITAEIVFIIRILAYSARKNKANGPPAYSTLKPDTSSDSPSVKSNGARFVSARVEIYHIIARGQVGIINHKGSWVILKFWNEKFPDKRMVQRRIRAKVTSYEIVCATARRAPIRAYLEFEAQPEPRIEYTVRLESARTNITPRFISDKEMGMGIGVQIIIARDRAIIGANRNNVWDEVDGRIGSLVKSLTPSAIGWRSPIGPTILGPFRCCMYPSTFRSIRVRKATARRIGAI